MKDRRIPGWIKALLAVGALVLVIPVLWIFASYTAKPLHPNPESIPTAVRAAPEPKWATAVASARRIVRANVAEQNLPGLSVAVGVDGAVVWAEGFGYADLKTSTTVSPGHRFRIGTISTTLMSAAVGLLLEDGRLKLDDEVQTDVPAFPRKQWPVTLRGLMAHTAGVNSQNGPSIMQHCERPVEAIRYFAESPLLFQPGTKYQHSQNGWILISAAVEAAATEPFFTFLQERFFNRLGMNDTHLESSTVGEGEDFPLATIIRELIYDPDAARDKSAPAAESPAPRPGVTSYDTRFSSDPRYGVYVMRPLDLSCYAGASSFLSTPTDLVRFGMAISSGTLLRPATLESIQSPQTLTSGEQTGHGLGWYRKTIALAGKPTQVTGHDGDLLVAPVASLMNFPEHRITVSVISNVSYADTSSVAARVAECFAQRQGNR